MDERNDERVLRQKRKATPKFKIGDNVYIRRRTSGEKNYNIKTERASQKLDCVKIGPYRIEKELPNDNYKVTLPQRMRIHPVFHVSLLSLTKNPETQKDETAHEEYEVEHILSKRIVNSQTEYLIKWKGYDEDENTWEPTVNLHCPDKIQEFSESSTFMGEPERTNREELSSRNKRRMRKSSSSRSSISRRIDESIRAREFEMRATAIERKTLGATARHRRNNARSIDGPTMVTTDVCKGT